MLRSLNSFKNHTIDARDGEIGKAHDFLFDDDSWAIRYLIVDTTRWLPGRKVLISAVELGQPQPDSSKVPVELTREKIKSSPDIDTDQPVSRQQEEAMHQRFGWPYYWMQPAPLGGAIMTPPAAPIIPEQLVHPRENDLGEPGDPNLRSANEIEGYHIEATDGRMGHVEDFIVDDETWIVRYLVVDTTNWLPGKKVLVAPEWRVDQFDWSERAVAINLSRERIKSAPEFHASAPIDRAYEQKLHDYYGRPIYWTTPEMQSSRK
jgi:hypothetical protein